MATAIFDPTRIPQKYRHLAMAISHYDEVSEMRWNGVEVIQKRAVFGTWPGNRRPIKDIDLVGLQDGVTFKVNCCTKRHTVTYTHKGELILHDHMDGDMDQLRALRTFGAGVSRCLEVREDLEKALIDIKGHNLTHNKNYEANYRKLPKPIFHYRRSRATWIKWMRTRYQEKCVGTGEESVGIYGWMRNTPTKRIDGWYEDLWDEVNETKPFAFVGLGRYESTVAPPWERWVDRWDWYKRVYSRGLGQAVYKACPSIGCYVIDADPNYMLGDKELRVTFTHKYQDPESRKSTRNKVCHGTALLEDKWYIIPDDAVLGHTRFCRKFPSKGSDGVTRSYGVSSWMSMQGGG